GASVHDRPRWKSEAGHNIRRPDPKARRHRSHAGRATGAGPAPGGRRMTDIVVFAFVSALNPTEVAVTLLLLLLPRPERLMFGYWVGAMVAGMASGLVIVFALEGTTAEHTTRHTLGPIWWLL